jgi:hypothetical protein
VTLPKGSPVRGIRELRTASSLAAWLLLSAVGVALVAWAPSADGHWAERHILPSYCATGEGERIVAGSLRWVAVALGLFMLAVAPAVARRVGRLAPRAAAASVLGVALAVSASLLVTELYMRRMHERLVLGAPPDPSGERDAAMAYPDPRLGWSYFPRRTTWVRVADRVVAYAIDAAGNRAPTADEALDTTRPSILFTGESIAFGYGLPYEETFVSLVARDLGVQTVNLAVVGYGNDQAYLRVLDALPRYRRPLAVVTLFLPDQIRRNVEPWRPRLALAPDGALVLVPPSDAPRIARLARELPYHGDEPLRVTAAILRGTADAARARGAFPLFVLTNYGPACLREDGREAWIAEELLGRQGLPFVRVDLRPEDRLPGLFERHPSLRGTQKIAAAVERALSEHLGERVLGAARRQR